MNSKPNYYFSKCNQFGKWIKTDIKSCEIITYRNGTLIGEKFPASYPPDSGEELVDITAREFEKKREKVEVWG